MNEQNRLSTLEQKISKMEGDITSIKNILTGNLDRSAHPSYQVTTASPPKPAITKIDTYDIPSRIKTIPNNHSTKNDNSKFFGIVASICFLLAASYFIKFAINSGWLTPMRQVGGAFLFGFTLVFTSLRLREKDQKYSSILAGTGIAIIYMSAFAGNMYYDLYNIYVALFLANLVSIACIYLFHNFKENYYAIAAMLGTYLIPAMLQTNTMNIYKLGAYYLIWGIAYSWISIALKNRLFIGAISYLGIFTFFMIATDRISGMAIDDLTFIVSFQALQFILFLIATIVYSLKVDNPLSSTEAWSLFPALLLFYTTEYYILNKIYSDLAPWIALMFGGLAILGYLLAKSSLPNKTFNSLPMLATYLAFITLHAGYLNIVPESIAPWFGLAVLFFVLKFSTYIKDEGEYWPAKLTLSWIFIIEILKSFIPSTATPSTIIVNLGFSIGLLFFGNEIRKTKNSAIKNASEPFYLLSILELLYAEKHIAEFLLSHTSSSLVTSIAWGVSALVLLLVAKESLSKKLATTTMVLFVVVAYKVLFMDLSSSAQGAKIISLVILGSLFYYAGYIYKNLEGNQRKAIREEAI